MTLKLKRMEFAQGLKAGFPISFGYFPIAITFGALSHDVLSLLQSILFSALVFAGASQFMVLSLVELSVNPLQMIIAAFLLNLRHLLMSSTLSHRIDHVTKKTLPLVAFGITDETFATTSVRTTQPSVSFMYGLELISYTSWVVGTAVGYIAGGLLPEVVQEGMGIALFALFTALLIPHAIRSLSLTITAIISASINTIFVTSGLLSTGWAIVTSILIASIVGTVFFPIPDQLERKN